MLLCLSDVLTAAECAEVLAAYTAAPARPGARSAGWHARLVKHNRQLASDHPAAQAASSLVAAALQRHPVFASAALAARIMPPLLVAYGVGETYGAHVDDALMRRGREGEPALRSDLSVTVFLENEDAYDGGALILDRAAGEESYKLPAGSAVLYASGDLHRVDAVTRGERRVAVTWIQSHVRDAGQRELLFDLDRLRRELFEREGKSPAFDLAAKSYANLLRRWAEP